MAPVEILGYAGTVLVMISFLRHLLIRLRILNAIGVFLVTLYAVATHTGPVALLDGFIVIINILQLIKHHRSAGNALL